MRLISVTPIYKQFEEAYKPLLITLEKAHFEYLINYKRAYYHTKQKVRDAAYCLEIYESIAISLSFPSDFEDIMYDITRYAVFGAYGAYLCLIAKYCEGRFA